jgi:hypothetical protein
MLIQNNVGKTTQTLKVFTNNKLGNNSFSQALEVIADMSTTILKGEKRIATLTATLLGLGFKAIHCISPRPKKDPITKKMVASKSLGFITEDQFDGLKAKIVKTYPMAVQRALAKATKDRTERDKVCILTYDNINWSKKSNQIVSDIQRSMTKAENKAEELRLQAEEDAKVLADPSYIPKPNKVSKKPSRNRSPKEVYVDNINQCIAILEEHETALHVSSPADLKTLLRKAITMIDVKSF